MIPRGGKRKGYTLRQHPNGNYSIAVPTNVGDMVPEGMRFSFELTDDGILLRPIRDTLPAWIDPGERA